MKKTYLRWLALKLHITIKQLKKMQKNVKMYEVYNEFTPIG